jgi:sigma-B regulation protein RsbU (phosphoserine phosphatase)
MLPPRRRQYRIEYERPHRSGLRGSPRCRPRSRGWRGTPRRDRRRECLSRGSGRVCRNREAVQNVGHTSELPGRLPDIPNLDLAARSRPLLEPSGDHYEVSLTPSGRWLALLADASGHGESAAAEVSLLSGLVRLRPPLLERPGAMLEFLNRRLAPRPHGAFITAFLAVFDPASRELVYASAGHPPPRLRRCRERAVFSLDAVGGPPLGVVPDQHYLEASMRLAPDDRIFLYTDGVTETFNVNREMFGVERLDRSLCCGDNAAGLLDRALHRLDQFLAGHARGDDTTLIALRVI